MTASRVSSCEITAPGRVNLIGEHIDYCGLPVLPMAIQRGIYIRATPRPDGQVALVNQDPTFEPRIFPLAPDIAPAAEGDWSNYVRAAAQAVHAQGARVGASLQVGSDLPAASGLSSSSALVVASALALLWSSGISADPIELAERLAEAERYVGLAGGGMDQAASLAGQEHHALLITFDPLSVTPVPVPGGWRFVVASSLIESRKSAENRAAYNERSASCSTALRQVAGSLSLPEGTSYGDLLSAVELDDLVGIAEDVLEGSLMARFRHVVTEARRVQQAVAAMADDDLEAFGDLMLRSHASLRYDYRVSCQELDELVDRAMGAGAVGARLTGAGFGGAALVVTDSARFGSVMTALREEFYRPRGVTVIDEVLFEVFPSHGARVARV